MMPMSVFSFASKGLANAPVSGLVCSDASGLDNPTRHALDRDETLGTSGIAPVVVKCTSTGPRSWIPSALVGGWA